MKRYKSERFLIGVFEIIELSRLVAQKFDSAACTHVKWTAHNLTSHMSQMSVIFSIVYL